MKYLLRILFNCLFVRPIVLIVMGLNVRHRVRLPIDGPAIIAANHNSHLDTLALMSLFPLSLLRKVRPVAAADYFFRTPALAWFSRNILGIIPLARTDQGTPLEDRLREAFEALSQGDILIVFPEGSRGDPERVSRFRSGIAFIANNFPEVPVFPIFLHGMGKALPKGESLLVPLFCDVFVGEPISGIEEREEFMECFGAAMDGLSQEENLPDWE